MSQSEQMEQAGGNTQTPAKPCQKSRNWFFTFNNPMEAEVSSEQMEHFLRMLEPKAYVFQLEVGESGTKHFQGCVSVKNPIVMPKWLCGKIHWEKCKSWAKAVIYCSKAEGRLEGPWGFGVSLPKPLKVITELRPWQSDLDAILQTEPDDRTIYWYWEPDGNVGKTAMAKYICTKYSALYLAGKATDAKYAVAKFVEKKVLHAAVFDYTRSMEEYISYEGLESIKNGILFNGKYESGMCMYDAPHVIVFANFAPNLEKLSRDRWCVKRIGEINEVWA